MGYTGKTPLMAIFKGKRDILVWTNHFFGNLFPALGGRNSIDFSIDMWAVNRLSTCLMLFDIPFLSGILFVDVFLAHDCWWSKFQEVLAGKSEQNCAFDFSGTKQKFFVPAPIGICITEPWLSHENIPIASHPYFHPTRGQFFKPQETKPHAGYGTLRQMGSDRSSSRVGMDQGLEFTGKP